MNPVKKFVYAELFHADLWHSNKTEAYIQKLIIMCPKKFLEGNEWTGLANKLTNNDFWTSNWQWVSNNPDVQYRQLFLYALPLARHTYCVRISTGITDKESEALAGWMLSVMLKEIPELILY